MARLSGKINVSEQLINFVRFEEPTVVIGSNQKVCSGLFLLFVGIRYRKTVGEQTVSSPLVW